MKIINNDAESKKTLFEVNVNELRALHRCVTSAMLEARRLGFMQVEETYHNMQKHLNQALSLKGNKFGEGKKHKSLRETPCPHCARKTRGEAALILHILTVHKDIKKVEG